MKCPLHPRYETKPFCPDCQTNKEQALQSLQGVELPPLPEPTVYDGQAHPLYDKPEHYDGDDMQAYARTAVAAAMARGAGPQGYETDFALMEAHRNAAADDYYKARHPMIDTIENRRTFEAGFTRGWRAAPTPEAAQPTQAEAPSEREAFALDPLEKAIDAYVADYETCYDGGTYTPDDEERFRIKDAIMGLLANPEWDRLWGEHIAALATQQAETPDENNQWIAEAKKTLDHLARFLYRTGAPHEVNWRDWIDSAEKHLATQQAGQGEALVDDTHLRRVHDLLDEIPHMLALDRRHESVSKLVHENVMNIRAHLNRLPTTPPAPRQPEALAQQEREAKVAEVERLLTRFIENDPDAAERFIESQLAQLDLRKRLAAKRAARSSEGGGK